MACRMEKNSRKFSLVWKGSVLIQKLCSRRKAQAVWETKICLRLSCPLRPGLGCHGRDAASTGCSNVALFHMFHIPKVQREDPSVTSQIRQTQADPFLWGPFHGRAQLVWVTGHCRGKGGQVCGTSGVWNSSCIQSWSEWVVRGTAHCLWNQKHLVSGQDVSEMEKSFEIP